MGHGPPSTRVALAALIALAAGGAWAQQPETPPPPQSPDADQETPVFGETVEVRVVNLEVVVTDRDGLPVTGLTAGDFRLLVDGGETPIRYFTEVRGGDAVAPGEAQPEGGTAPEVAGVPDLVPGTPVGTSYLLFVDDFFSIARDRDQVLRSMMDQLSRLGPEDRMAVVAFDGRQLEMLSSWSSSAPELDRVLRKATQRPAYGLQRRGERRNFLAGQPAVGDPGFTSPRTFLDNRLDVSERYYAELLEQQVSSEISAVAAALRGFASPPGRKVLILLSGGWPYDIPEFVTQQFGRAVVEPGVPRGRELYAPLVDTANQLGYTVYTVDVPGLSTDSLIDAEQPDLPNEGEQQAAFVRENNAEYTLRYVSEQTGGRPLINAGRKTALERAAADTRTYYWIGFVPKWSGDDSSHHVDVRVLRQGLRVRSRSGYLDISRRHEVSMAVESILLFGDGPGSRPLHLAVSAPKKTSRSTMQVRIDLAIPATELTLIPVGDRKVAELELRVAASDESGRRSEIPVIPVKLVVAADPKPGQLAVYRTTLELRRAKNHLAVALYDRAAGTIWSATADVHP
jgi:VWFA-related protein